MQSEPQPSQHLEVDMADKLDDKIAAFLDRVFDCYIKQHPTSRIAAEECKAVGLKLGVYEQPDVEVDDGDSDN